MTNMNIDLKQSYDDLGPTEVSKEHYPSFHYQGPKELDLPAEGEMTIRFKKVSSSQNESNGKTQHSCTVDVLKILSVTEAEKREKKTDEALDELAREKASEKEDY
jgi:hypothetical protein